MLLRGKGHGGLIIHAAAAALDYPAIDASTAIGADCLWLADGAFPKDSRQIAAGFSNGGSWDGSEFVSEVVFAGSLDLSACNSSGGISFEWAGSVIDRNTAQYGHLVTAEASSGTRLATVRLRYDDTAIDVLAPEVSWGWSSDGNAGFFIEDGSFHHYVVTLSTSNQHTYRDGALFNHKNLSGSSLTFSQTASEVWLSQGFDAAITRAAIYGRVLTASEVSQLYNSPFSILSN